MLVMAFVLVVAVPSLLVGKWASMVLFGEFGRLNPLVSFVTATLMLLRLPYRRVRKTVRTLLRCLAVPICALDL